MDCLQREEGGCKHIYRPIVARATSAWYAFFASHGSQQDRSREVWWCTQSQRAVCFIVRVLSWTPSIQREFSTLLHNVRLWGASNGWVSNVREILDLSCFWLGSTLTTHPANMFSYSAWWECKGFSHIWMLSDWPSLSLDILRERLSFYKCTSALCVFLLQSMCYSLHK